MAVARRETPAIAAANAEAHAARSPGALVTLEGIDGSGKSTLARQLHARLVDRGVDAVLTSEPTSTWLGEAVRRGIREAPDPFVDAFLFLADHADHVVRIRAWIDQGQVVVSDRYGESCLAYQAASLQPRLAASGTDALAWLRGAQAPFHRAPDVCLLLDLPAEEALRRIAGRAEHEKFEQAAFLERVRGNYLALAKHEPWFEVLDATRSPAESLERAWQALVRRGIAPL